MSPHVLRALGPSEVLDHEDRTFLQFEGLDNFVVDPLGFRIREQSLHRFALRFPIGKRDRPKDLAGLGPRPALTGANRDRAVPLQVRSPFPQNSHVMRIALPARNDNDRHLILPSGVSHSLEQVSFAVATCRQV